MTTHKGPGARRSDMHVAVGSENPVKVAATERALAGQFAATVEAVGVASGVAEQPRGHDVTITGARNRAGAALEAVGGDLGVGIEGGVATFPGRPDTAGNDRQDESDPLFLIMWAAVTDGQRWGVGGGPSLELPPDVAARLRDGAELGPVMDDLLETDGVARDQGAAGVLTGGSIDRQSALEHAVAGALGPFVTEYY